MWGRKMGWGAVGWVVLFALVWGSGAALTASEYPRAEWQVGQDKVSPQDLEVTAPPPAPEELTIQEAVALALRHNLGFRRTVQRLLSAGSGWRVAQQRWDLELFGRIERSGDGETLEERQAGVGLSYYAVTGADFSVVAELDRLESAEREQMVTATLRQPLLAGRGDASAAYEEVRRARNAYRAALMTFFVERQELVERVISAYLNTVQRQQVLGIQESSVKMAEEAVRDADLRLKEQVAVELDLMRAQLQLAGRQTAEVLVEGRSRRAGAPQNRPASPDQVQMVGRTRTDHIVVFDGTDRPAGRYLDVEITGATALTLFGALRCP